MYFLTGENWYARDEALRAIVAASGAESVERPDPASVTPAELRDMLTTQSLFSTARCVVLAGFADVKPLWEALESVVEHVLDDITLVMNEPKPDKRTRTYKALQKIASVQDFPLWTPRDTHRASEWLLVEAKRRGVSLKTRHATQLIERAGVDQGRLAAALEKLELAGEITPERIEALVESRPSENVFGLLETALRGDGQAVHAMLHTLRQTEDPYRVFGLLSTQLLQLAALVYGRGTPVPDIAKDLGVAPFVLSRLQPHATRLSGSQAGQLLAAAGQADMKMKSVAIDPWLLVEELLQKLAHR